MVLRAALLTLLPALAGCSTLPCGPLPQNGFPECPPDSKGSCITRCTDADCRPVCQRGGCLKCVDGQWRTGPSVDCSPGCWATDGG